MQAGGRPVEQPAAATDQSSLVRFLRRYCRRRRRLSIRAVLCLPVSLSLSFSRPFSLIALGTRASRPSLYSFIHAIPLEVSVSENEGPALDAPSLALLSSSLTVSFSLPLPIQASR